MNNKIIKLGMTGIIVYLLFVISAYAGPNVTLNLTHNWSNTNWLDLLFSPITDLTGSFGVIIIIVFVIGAVYNKQKKVSAFLFVSVIILGVMMQSLPSEWYVYAALLLALSMGVIIARIFSRSD